MIPRRSLLACIFAPVMALLGGSKLRAAPSKPLRLIRRPPDPTARPGSWAVGDYQPWECPIHGPVKGVTFQDVDAGIEITFCIPCVIDSLKRSGVAYAEPGQ